MTADEATHDQETGHAQRATSITLHGEINASSAEARRRTALPAEEVRAHIATAVLQAAETIGELEIGTALNARPTTLPGEKSVSNAGPKNRPRQRARTLEVKGLS